MTVSTAQGRYYITNTPQASPGTCTICGYAGPDRSYLDPRLDFEFYGSLYFCEECMASMAQQMGFIEPAKARSLEARVEEAERELVHLRAATVAMDEVRRALGISVPTANAVDSVLPVDGSVASDFVEGQQELPFDSVGVEGGTDSGPDEQVDFAGRDDVRDTDSSRGFNLDFI